jgi:hypothetical protein
MIATTRTTQPDCRPLRAWRICEDCATEQNIIEYFSRASVVAP